MLGLVLQLYTRKQIQLHKRKHFGRTREFGIFQDDETHFCDADDGDAPDCDDRDDADSH